jgi:hypothetical protein
MASGASSSTEKLSGDIHYVPKNQAPSKLPTYGFAIAIIFGIIGVGAGVTGVCGYFHVGALSNMAQVNAMIMMAAGGGGGVILLIVGIVGSVKNRQASSHADDKHSGSSQKSESTAPSKKREDIDTQGNTVFGPEAYEICPGVKVVGKVEPIPEHLKAGEGERDPFFNKPIEQSFPLLYISEKVTVNGKEMDLTFNNLEKITGIPFRDCYPYVKEQYGNTPLKPGWRRMSMGIISEKSRGMSWQAQKELVEGKGYDMPQALETAIFMYMVHAFTDRWVYPKGTYTRCIEKIGDKDPIIVGWGLEEEEDSGPGGFSVHYSLFDFNIYGVGAVRK